MSLVTRILGKDTEHQVPNKELLRFATGIAGQNVTYGTISNWVKYFLMTALGINSVVVGLCLMIPKIWDAINDPIIGAIVDKHIFKNGEKLRPFLKIMPLPIGIIGIIMFVDFGSVPLTLTLSVIGFLVYEMLYTFHDVAQWGMTALITSDPKERDRVSQVARIGAMVGSLLPGLIPIILDLTNGSIDPNHYQAPLLEEKYTLLIIAVLFSFGGMSVALFGYSAKERVKTKKVEGNVSVSFKLILQNKIVLLIILGQILGSLTLHMDSALFFKYMYQTVYIGGFRLEGMTVSFVYGIIVGLPATLMMFLATKIARALGGFKNVLILQMVMNLSIRLCAYFYGKFIGYQGLNILAIAGILSVAGLPSSLNGIAVTALWGDSIDYIEWKTGQRNEATVFAMQNMSAKITGAINTGITGFTYALLAYDANTFEGRNGSPMVSEAFKNWSWEVFILAPAFGSLLFLIPLLFIRIDKHTRDRITKELEERRARKKAAESATKLGEIYS